MNNITTLRNTLFIVFLTTFSFSNAQTIINGFFPQKNEFTVASSYSYKSYDNFFMGNTQTETTPMNMGEISSSVVSVYGEYGILNWLSTTVTLPYISMQNETGVLDPISQTDQVSGVQDLSMFLKARVLDTKINSVSKIAVGGAAGVSVPVGGYEEAGILSLGNGATAIDGCGFVQINASRNLFVELQAAYSMRNNSDFDIPNATLFSAKLGYYNKWFYAHAKIGTQNSLDGLDIGTPEFVEAGAAGALPETEVDYTNFYLDLYVPVYKQSIGVSTGYTANMSGKNYDRASGFSVGLVYKVQ
ncbi:hypothetical protein [Aquimarina litoralis]|uniref:hypothetical protein n=1 Tax=Aquimarina litoralis TaxID=584605 RepID=UPI001C59F165|nr:hypothetical protein [Aquimarina litoralis]MBW1297330.1 hypothetical protein [Aquimarina litoralis]